MFLVIRFLRRIKSSPVLLTSIVERVNLKTVQLQQINKKQIVKQLQNVFNLKQNRKFKCQSFYPRK